MKMLENVRKLTRGARRRRIPVALRAPLTCLIGSIAATTSGALHAATEWHSTADMAAVAEALIVRGVDQSSSNTSGDTSVQASQLDHRLKLAKCSVPLAASVRPGTVVGPKTLVVVQCTGAKPWKIYVPVEISVRRTVWTARQALPRGHVLTAADLVDDVRDIARMTSSYVSSIESLIGQKLKTSILAGRVLTLQLIEADSIVQRGQTVTLTVSTGGLDIRMTGKALSDGVLNQRIRVENLNSGRVVEGIVRSRESVEILVPGSTRTGSGAN